MLQGSFPLHWPLINSDHMRTKLAKRELERKRIEDDQRSAPRAAVQVSERFGHMYMCVRNIQKIYNKCKHHSISQ